MAREASRDSESHNISLMRTGPAGLLDELAAVLGYAIMIVRPSRRIARGRWAAYQELIHMPFSKDMNTFLHPLGG